MVDEQCELLDSLIRHKRQESASLLAHLPYFSSTDVSSRVETDYVDVMARFSNWLLSLPTVQDDEATQLVLEEGLLAWLPLASHATTHKILKTLEKCGGRLTMSRLPELIATMSQDTALRDLQRSLTKRLKLTHEAGSLELVSAEASVGGLTEADAPAGSLTQLDARDSD